jgi:hypothetical protein
MSNHAPETRSMEEPKTWAELCQRYPDQWVTVVGTELDDDGQFDFRAARVISQGTSRAEAYARAKPVLDEYTDYGCFFTGPIRPLRPGFLHIHDLPSGFDIDGLLGPSFLRQFNYELRSREGRLLVDFA